MPHRKMNKQRSGRSRKSAMRSTSSTAQSWGLNEKIRVPFHNFNNIGSSGVAASYLNPSNVGLQHLSNIAQCFQYYRFTDFELTFYPLAGVSMAFAYSINPDDTAATSVGTMSQLPCFTYMAASETIPCTVRIPRKTLLTDQPIKWWRTDSTTSFQNNQGYLYFLTTASTSPLGNYTVRGFVEFMGPVNYGFNVAIDRPLEEKKVLPPPYPLTTPHLTRQTGADASLLERIHVLEAALQKVSQSANTGLLSPRVSGSNVAPTLGD